MIVELLTLGDELLDGRRIDTNTAWLGRRLTALGVPPRYRQTTTDRKRDIEFAFRMALTRSDLIISTGGLGPTADDLTFEALAEAVGRRLEYREAIYQRIVERFEKRGLRCPDSNKRQAILPEGSEEIVNEWGTAPGLRVDVGPKLIFCLPGVPVEMQGLFDKGIAPVLTKRLAPSAFRKEKVYHFVGLPESHVEEAVDRSGVGRIPNADVRIAYTASFPVIDVMLSVSTPEPENLEAAMAVADGLLKKELADQLVAEGDETVESRVVGLLKEKGWKLAVAESVTGGLVSAQIVNVPGSSDVFLWGGVTYSNALKVANLKVSEETLQNFGAVSEECALEMARGARNFAGADVGLATTGIAGPTGGTEKKPLGLVFIAWVGPTFERVSRYQFRWDRNRNRMLASYEALKGLLGLLKGDDKNN